MRIWTWTLRPAQVRVRRLTLARGVERDLQVAAGVAEPALAGRLTAEVAVVGDDHLVGEQLGDRVHVGADVGDDADPELVADLAERVGVQPLAPAERVTFSANEATLLVRPEMVR